ncbi:MAG: radical SAM protein [Deltaproteobacteria bacterium]|nr:radical SAM protein [Deltaproteobacteria bacterium]MCL5892976.1 radical SAM protein [Deltaproteobacteria bacterium]
MAELSLSPLRKRVKSAVVRNALYLASNYIIPKLTDETIIKISDKLNNFKAPAGKIFFDHIFVNLKRKLPHLSKNVKRGILDNFISNFLLLSGEKRKEFIEKNGFYPPLFYVISPTMHCNLKCYGCYSANYTRKDMLSYEKINQIIDEGKKFGIFFYTLSGGEPFVRKDILDVIEKNSDCYFQIYTNGSLIDGKMAERLAGMGNVFPCISVEGFEDETDERRGKGHFKKVVSAMKNLKDNGMLFGFSATATRFNNNVIVSDEFIDFYVKQGCFLGWYFNYIPIGREPDMNLMPTPEQRNYRRKRVVEIRETKPIVVADFWNDGVLSHGCLSGGRVYLHINANGGVEPCVFAQFAADNIFDKSMEEILNSMYFKSIRKKQMGIKNRLRPCMIIDHPDILRTVVAEGGAKATQEGGDSIISELKDKIDTYSQSYGRIADAVWEEEFDNGKFFYNYAGEKIELNEDDYYRRSFYPLKGGKTVKNETKAQ